MTILTGRRMTDLVLPAAVPMETYIDDTVAVLSEVLEDTPADVLGGFNFTAQGVWAFARPGSPPLKLDQSLDDAGVVDGSLLTLVSVSRTTDRWSRMSSTRSPCLTSHLSSTARH